jgi:16S rRNA C967 or C1407 C5-methylase (RsmB/RsmF family)
LQVFAAENQDVASWFERQPGFAAGDWAPWPFPDAAESSAPADAALAARSFIRPVLQPLPGPPLRPRLRPLPPLGGRSVGVGDGVNDLMPRHWRALLPHVHGTDGFFVARWRRTKGI